MTQSANTLDISRPGSFRMNAGICCALGPLLLIAAILFSDTSFTGFERTLVLATSAFVAVLCVAGIISGWNTLKASKGNRLGRLNALALARFVQDSPSAKELLKDHLSRCGKANLEDLTYKDVDDLERSLRDAKETDLLTLKI